MEDHVCERCPDATKRGRGEEESRYSTDRHERFALGRVYYVHIPHRKNGSPMWCLKRCIFFFNFQQKKIHLQCRNARNGNIVNRSPIVNPDESWSWRWVRLRQGRSFRQLSANASLLNAAPRFAVKRRRIIVWMLCFGGRHGILILISEPSKTARQPAPCVLRTLGNSKKEKK